MDSLIFARIRKLGRRLSQTMQLLERACEEERTAAARNLVLDIVQQAQRMAEATAGDRVAKGTGARHDSTP